MLRLLCVVRLCTPCAVHFRRTSSICRKCEALVPVCLFCRLVFSKLSFAWLQATRGKLSGMCLPEDTTGGFSNLATPSYLILGSILAYVFFWSIGWACLMLVVSSEVSLWVIPLLSVCGIFPPAVVALVQFCMEAVKIALRLLLMHPAVLKESAVYCRVLEAAAPEALHEELCEIPAATRDQVFC